MHHPPTQQTSIRSSFPLYYCSLIKLFVRSFTNKVNHQPTDPWTVHKATVQSMHTTMENETQFYYRYHQGLDEDVGHDDVGRGQKVSSSGPAVVKTPLADRRPINNNNINNNNNNNCSHSNIGKRKFHQSHERHQKQKKELCQHHGAQTEVTRAVSTAASTVPPPRTPSTFDSRRYQQGSYDNININMRSTPYSSSGTRYYQPYHNNNYNYYDDRLLYAQPQPPLPPPSTPALPPPPPPSSAQFIMSTPAAAGAIRSMASNYNNGNNYSHDTFNNYSPEHYDSGHSHGQYQYHDQSHCHGHGQQHLPPQHYQGGHTNTGPGPGQDRGGAGAPFKSPTTLCFERMLGAADHIDQSYGRTTSSTRLAAIFQPDMMFHHQGESNPTTVDVSSTKSVSGAAPTCVLATMPETKHRNLPDPSKTETPLNSRSNRKSDPGPGCTSTLDRSNIFGNGVGLVDYESVSQNRKVDSQCDNNGINVQADDRDDRDDPFVQILKDGTLYKKLILYMALQRQSKDASKSHDGSSHTNPPPQIITEGFYWKDYPCCELLLYNSMGHYYELSTQQRQSKQQQSFNNNLVSLVRKTAEGHGYHFCPDLSDKKLRDRIRCFFKTHLQNAKKRLVTMQKHSTKEKQKTALRSMIAEARTISFHIPVHCRDTKG